MSYKIVLSEDFKKDLKQLSKKYISLANDIAELGKLLIENLLTVLLLVTIAIKSV